MIGSTLFLQLRHRQTGQWFYRRSRQRGALYEPRFVLSAGMNLMMGMTTNALLLAIFWGINGWAQSMGVGPCAVSLALVRR